MDSKLLRIDIIPTTTGYQGKVFYMSGTDAKEIATLFGRTELEIRAQIEDYLRNDRYFESPEFRADALKASGLPEEFISKMVQSRNKSRLTVLTPYLGQLPASIETLKEGTEGMQIMCMGCKSCQGAPCTPCMAIMDEIEHMFGMGDYFINVQRVASFVDIIKLTPTFQHPVLILDGELHIPPDVLTSGMFTFDEKNLHDVEFDAIDEVGKPYKAVFQNCATLLDSAGDEILHVRKNDPEGIIEYLPTLHPDSTKVIGLLTMHVTFINTKLPKKITLVDFRNKFMSVVVRR